MRVSAGGMNAGSIYAEAELDISKFESAAGSLEGLSLGIAGGMGVAAAGLALAQAGVDRLGAGFEGLGARIAAGLAASSQAVATAGQLSQSVAAALASGVSRAGSIGRQFSAGLASGIQAGRSGVISAAVSVATAAAAAARAALQIHSPSRVTEGFGENFDLGFVRGVQNRAGDVDRAVAEAVYVRPPVGVARSEAVRGAREGMSFDYAALAAASAARPIILNLDGREVARINSENSALAQNGRARQIALRYGIRD